MGRAGGASWGTAGESACHQGSRGSFGGAGERMVGLQGEHEKRAREGLIILPPEGRLEIKRDAAGALPPRW